MKKRRFCIGLLGILFSIALIACGQEKPVTENNGTDSEAVTEVNEETDNSGEEDVTENEIMDVSEYEVERQEINYTVSGDLLWKQDGVEYGEMVEIEYESSVTGTTRKANVLLPAGYTEEKQ